MSTILFSEIVFGPIHSRRMGSSLGMNLLPFDGKLCNFDCIYCECGFNENFRTRTKLPTRQNVKDALKDKLITLKEEGTKIDVITFAGNGEPTMHPEFAGVIDDTIELRNKYSPHAKISVLTNGISVGKKAIFEALQKIEIPVLKLDVLQTMFLRGSFKGQTVDNTTEEEVSAWLELVKELSPREVMIYTIDRETPAKELVKAPIEVLNEIAERVKQLGIKTNVAG